MIVAFDTMTLIWSMKENPTKENAEFHRRAELLMKLLARENATLVLPTIVVGEYLCKIPKPAHGLIIAKMQEQFRMAPFDIRASSVASDLWQRVKKAGGKSVPSRRLLKSDVMVVASAVVAGAKQFYTHDKECRDVASLVMNGLSLPTHDEKLFPED